MECALINCLIQGFESEDLRLGTIISVSLGVLVALGQYSSLIKLIKVVASQLKTYGGKFDYWVKPRIIFSQKFSLIDLTILDYLVRDQKQTSYYTFIYA